MGEDAIDVSGIDEGELLAALHNATEPRGLGYIHARGDMTPEEGRQFIESDATRMAKGGWHADYVHGRPVKVSVRDGRLYGALVYDRDAPGGPGSCARVVEGLRAKVG